MALAGPGEGTPEGLLRDADAAMYEAKARGRDRHAVFGPEMRGRSAKRLELEGDLRRALRDPGREFRVFYQPEASVASGEVVGVEALVRWEHPERGLLPPSEFVGLAEETGLIVSLGRWVLGEACRQAEEWRRRFPGAPGAEPLVMSVNLSARQFQDLGLVDAVDEALGASGLEPGGLVLEITESVLMEDAPSTVSALGGLRKLGVGLAIDDFGTGYSSLAYLTSFPVDLIKIDRSIVSGLDRDRGNLAVVLSTVALAHALDLTVVAEGVETRGEAEKLKETGCDLAHGYHFARPLPGEEAATQLSGG
ncbi:MAG: GGDEF domain-containing phosphodiesterase [Actinomycetota bacterium]|nr:GGDEF domain-containing phosphodiesterase [Actinomycetota bacterium]